MAKKKAAKPTLPELLAAIAATVATFDKAMEALGDEGAGNHFVAKLRIHARAGNLTAIRDDLKSLGHG